MLTIAYDGAGGTLDVAELTKLPPNERPKAFCPACEGELQSRRATSPTAKIQRRANFAHRPDANCYAAGGEGEIHLEAKLHLQRELRRMLDQRVPLAVANVCSCGRCGVDLVPQVWIPSEHDTIRVEVRLGPGQGRVPDVLICRGAEPLLALEVVFSNPCSPEKLVDLERLRLTTFEVKATSILGDEDVPRWASEMPLPALRAVVPPKVPMLCPECRELPPPSVAAQGYEEEPPKARPEKHVVFAWQLDRYRPGGRWQSTHFSLERVRRDASGEWRAWLWVRDWRGVRTRLPGGWEGDVAQDVATLVDAASRLLKARFKPDGDRVSVWRSGQPIVRTWWWSDEEKDWVSGYLFEDLKAQFPRSFGRYNGTLWRWQDEGRIRKLLVRSHANSPKRFPVAHGGDVERLRGWLEKKQRTASVRYARTFRSAL